MSLHPRCRQKLTKNTCPVPSNVPAVFSTHLARYALDQYAKELGVIQKQITAKKKVGENADAELAEAEKHKAKEPALAEAESTAKATLDAALHKIGNIVHE